VLHTSQRPEEYPVATATPTPALTKPDTPAVDPILEAALSVFAQLGIRRASTDDVARAAGVSRVTVYRRFGTKDQLVRAAILHETSRIMEQIAVKVTASTDATERMALGFALTVTTLREHPILNRILELDRDLSLAWLTVDSGPVIELTANFIATLMPDDHPTAKNAASRLTSAAILIRLIQSFVLIPDALPVLGTYSDLLNFARTNLTWIANP
jgi:AcrR family transcriptional regulator